MTVLKKVVGWLKESNRLKHLKAGLVVFALMLLAAIAAECLFESRILIDMLLSLGAVLVGMCSVEYIQRESGGKWDWYDVLAGSIIPLAIFVISLIICAV